MIDRDRTNNILLAPLGESPIVVTAMFDALLKHPDGPHVTIDKVIVPYPSGDNVDLGATLIENTLQHDCEVELHKLPFTDVNSEETCIEYLRSLDAILQQHAADDVYLSIAGGRKSMAAFTAIVSQFHPQVKGIYHILDRHEDDPNRRHFFSIELLYEEPDAIRQSAMRPPMDDLKLITLPFQRFAQAHELRRWLSATNSAKDLPSVFIPAEAEMFFRRIFGSLPANEITAQVWLTTQAAEQFKRLQKRDHAVAERYTNCFSEMRSPTMLQQHCHLRTSHQGQTYAFYKKGHTKERPFFYTEPPLRPRKGHIERVIIAGLSEHINERDYDPDTTSWLKQAPFTVHCRLEELLPQESALIIPLGTSPMVATQLFTLLQKQRKTIRVVALLYPERQREIVQGAKMLYKVFTDKRLSSLRHEHTPDVQCFPIVNISDIDAQEACEQFSHTLGEAITKLKEDYPAATIQLSVSGGRKAMAILTYFAAQYYGLQHVWHTLITDPAIEKQVEQETALNRLEFISDHQKAERLFLLTYPHEAFTAFSIPVIPFNRA